jgi:lipoprotein-anchoring transpeptidase ErfK/SrfK
MQSIRLSRRKFIKLGGGILAASAAAAPFTRAALPALAGIDPVGVEPARRPFGRAIQGGLIVRDKASVKGAQVRTLKLNEMIALKGQTSSDESPTTYNKIWYQTDDGFIYSAYVQPVENVTNQPVDGVDAKGFWGEISVPITEARVAASPKAGVVYRYPYSCIFRIMARAAADDGSVWYQASEGGGGLWVRAEHVRPVPADDITPLSPDVPADQKRIEVDLANQVATAYESDKPVFSARVATGTSFRLADGTLLHRRTIPGEHRVYLKSPTQHMTGGTPGAGDYYDLPGIGWCSYFTASGIAFHTAYWHNDFGIPRSHGCVNMLPEDARWVYRWTLPNVPYDEWKLRTAKPADGTLVKVF